MPGVTSGQRLRAMDVRVLGFVAANSGKYSYAEVQAKIPEATFHIRESLDRLVFFNKVTIDAESGIVSLLAKKPSEPKTRRRIPRSDPVIDTRAASHAIRAALASPFPKLRRAAVDVLRGVFLREPKMTKRAQRLGISIEALRKLKIDFPEYWEDAENRTASPSIRT